MDDEYFDYEYYDYDSGPFCRHYGDPTDCELDCATCGHKCNEHEFEEPGNCDECSCLEYKEPL